MQGAISRSRRLRRTLVRESNTSQVASRNIAKEKSGLARRMNPAQVPAQGALPIDIITFLILQGGPPQDPQTGSG
jgi:hypothetical protein